MKSENFSLLVVNVGSATIKSRLFAPNLTELAWINADYGSSGMVVMTGRSELGDVFEDRMARTLGAEGVLRAVYDRWRHWLEQSPRSLIAIGHRIVHGGSVLKTPTLLTSEIARQLADLDQYAPLHNPLNRLGVSVAETVFPGISQYGVFDTAFHRQMPPRAVRYPIPATLSSRLEFQRFGFHGISCAHAVKRAAALLTMDLSQINAIVLHLGGGASATAVQGGIGIDTSMGFSPTEGLPMATRSGDIDPMILLALMREGWTADRLEQLLNRESGLRGLCGISDMRQILEHADQGDEKAFLALEIYCYRIKKYVGAYSAVLGKVDALIFTGGIGEHAPAIRMRIVQGMERFGFALDDQGNEKASEQDRDIAGPSSETRILVIHAEEEREIAAQILPEITNRTSS